MIGDKPVKVLIVDDEVIVNEMARFRLINLGYEVVGCAYSGPEAVELTCQLRPDVVLMDLQMTNPITGHDDSLAGLHAAQCIQERCPTPVILLTVHESAELIQQAGTAGVGAYLLKPVPDNDLERAITLAVARFNDMLALHQLNVKLSMANEQLQREISERRRAEAEREKLIIELKEAIAHVKRLSGLLPLCASCKKIRDDKGYWQQVEVYIQDHSEANFSHGLCPECQLKLYPKDLYPYLYE